MAETKKKITITDKSGGAPLKSSNAKAPQKNGNSGAKSPSKQGSAQNKGKKNSKNVKHTQPSDKTVHKLLPFVWFVLAIFLFLCFILRDVFGFTESENLFGPVGEGLHIFFFGLFGIGAYLLVVLLFYLGVMWRRLIDRRRLAVKLILAFVIILLISALFEVFVTDDDYPGIDVLWQNGGELVGGGIIGGSIGWLSYAGIKLVGSILVILALLTVFVLLFFDLTPYNIAVYVKARRKLKAERRALEEAERLAEEDDYVEEDYDEEIPVYKKERKKDSERDDKDSRRIKIVKKEEEDTPSEDEVFDDGFFDNKKDGEEEKIQEDETEKDSEKQSEIKEDPVETEEAEENKDEEDDGTFKLRSVFEEHKADQLHANDEDDDAEVHQVTTDRLAEPEIAAPEPEKPQWNPPPIDLLVEDKGVRADFSESIANTKTKLLETLRSFGIGVKDIGYSIGPTITRYEVVPDTGVRVRAIANLVDDIAMNLATVGVRIEAPIPNKPAVGVEVPNEVRATVRLRSILDTDVFRNSTPLTVCLGQDVAGKNVYFDIKKMPHMIIAGTTGSGKSVCINGIVTSLLYKNPPDRVKLIMIDPKKVEFSIYQHIPHLYCPIISDPRKAAGALASAVAEMERRYTLVEDVGVRDIDSYNNATANDPDREYLPKLVIVIDELADLMMMAKADVEQFITRIAQKARAVGIHLIIGTQRPSVDVITGLIKANVPSRIACTVKSQVDSRTIIDISGAEKLIGQGDMLFSPVGLAKPMRVQGAFLEDDEVSSVVDFIKSNNAPVEYNTAFMESMEAAAANVGEKKTGGAALDAADMSDDNGDAKFRQAVEIAINEGKISTSLLQRKLEIGYGRAAKLIDRMEELGYVSESDGNKPRRILITKQDFYEKVINNEVTSSDE